MEIELEGELMGLKESEGLRRRQASGPWALGILPIFQARLHQSLPCLDNPEWSLKAWSLQPD